MTTQSEIPFLDLRSINNRYRQPLTAAFSRVLESGWYIMGRELDSFEAEFAGYCGTHHCIGVGNGLEALHLILRGMGIGAGDEVIVPANTYIATINNQAIIISCVCGTKVSTNICSRSTAYSCVLAITSTCYNACLLYIQAHTVGSC